MANCEECMNFCYDEDFECYVCMMDLDQDELYKFMSGRFPDCPYFRPGDEYTIVRKQI